MTILFSTSNGLKWVQVPLPGRDVGTGSENRGPKEDEEEKKGQTSGEQGAGRGTERRNQQSPRRRRAEAPACTVDSG